MTRTFLSLPLDVLALLGAAMAVGGRCTLDDLTIGHAKDGPAGEPDGGVPPSSDAFAPDRPTGVPDASHPSDVAGPDQPTTPDAPASTDASGDGDATPPPCPTDKPGVTNCGPNCESCASSPVVPGGTFFRSYDGVMFKDQGNPATVSSFRLDKYEATVGRFRQFVAAAIGGWKPAAGSGKHTHLNGGQGVADSSAPGSFETGWNIGWNNNLSTTTAGWDAILGCQGSGTATWTPSAGGNENMPIGCLNWYQAYAFCIWDGGFLPSEAEWNYAASGGSEQRAYPWSSPPDSVTIDCSHSTYWPPLPVGGALPVGPQFCSAAYLAGISAVLSTDVGLTSPKGDGRWGHADLAGNLSEWNMDWFTFYASPCADCAYLSNASEPVTAKLNRGGSYRTFPAGVQTSTQGSAAVTTLGASVFTSNRIANVPNGTDSTFGVRCARAP